LAMMKPLEVPALQISEEEAEVRFEKLQAKLISQWQSMDAFSLAERTTVVVPSQTIEFECQGAEMQAYEERMLFLLMRLRQPRMRMIYVSSQTILPTTLDYYMSLMPGVITSHAMSRFSNLSPEDRSPRPLTIKLLERPHLCEKIRSLIPDPDRAILITYNVTLHERDLALCLGLPLYGSDPSLFYLGSKSGSRDVFAKAEVSYPMGIENLRSLESVKSALVEMRAAKPDLENAMVKFESMQFELPSINLGVFAKGLEEIGGIVEERIRGRDFSSPSVQMRVSPLGDVEILSTHDQLLGGPSGQSFLGSRFPADPAYGPLIAGEARKIGERLADLGALGRFAVDFVVVRDENDDWKSFAIEINLRQGGTTHPFMILQFLTEGTFVAEEGLFRAPSGKAKYYVASDHLESTLFRAFTPTDLFDIVIRHQLHFDEARQTGVLLHMLATVAENGRFGVVAVGDSPEEAQALRDRVQSVIEEEARVATAPPSLPES